MSFIVVALEKELKTKHGVQTQTFHTISTTSVTYDIHESEEVVLHVLLSMKSNHRVVNSQQDFNVVVFLPGISAAPAADGVVDLLGYRVERPRYVEFRFCTQMKTEEGKLNMLW